MSLRARKLALQAVVQAMPPDKSPARGRRRSPANTAERFDARDGTGRAFSIEKIAADSRKKISGDIRWSGAGASYQLHDGAVVERVNESLFRVLSTGTLLRRNEITLGTTTASKLLPRDEA